MKCLEIDIMAVKVYQKLADLPVPDPVKTLFRTLHDDETRHVAYWNGLLKVAKAGGIGEIFENSEQMLFELTNIAKRAHAIEHDLLKNLPTDINGLFLNVIKLEYVMLHPSFLALFHFADILPGHRTMEDEYLDHFDHISGALNTQSAENPMYSLFSELLRRVWDETKRQLTLSQSDALSGVLNRRGFHAQIQPLLHLARRKHYVVAFMVVDVDRFKDINDRFGHQAGDKVLKLVAESILKSVRQSDVVARFGGDEFVALMLDVNTDALERMAQKIKAKIEKESALIAPTSVSIGIASLRLKAEADQALELLIKEADAALYQVKESGRNSFQLRSL